MDAVLYILNIDIHNKVLQYWHLVQLNNRMQSDVLIRKFIYHRVLYALGVGAGLPDLLNLTIPVALLYGEHDYIAPPHQGLYISNLSGIPVYVMNQSSHVPYTVNNGEDFLDVCILVCYSHSQYVCSFIFINCNYCRSL